MHVLATNMDGTFIPLDGNQDNRRDLDELTQLLTDQAMELVYVTGRHFESVLQAIQASHLPTPEWIICDVGTNIYRRGETGEHRVWNDYQTHLDHRVSGYTASSLQPTFSSVAGLRLQEPEKQDRFKLSYYCPADQLTRSSQTIREILGQNSIPYHVISSVDPFNGGGLIDLLPLGVTKAHALDWWAQQCGHPSESILFAGDSGNDLAALTARYRSIVVGNATAEIKSQVRQSHAQSGWSNRLFIADEVATSGVLAGVKFFTTSRPTSP